MPVIVFTEHRPELIVLSDWVTLHVRQSASLLSSCLAKHYAKAPVGDSHIVDDSRGILFCATRYLRVGSFSS